MNFFFDRCIAIRLARMLAAYDSVHKVTHLDDDARFTKDTEDVDFIAILAKDNPKPVLVTADVAMRRKPVERQELRSSGLSIVFLRARFNSQGFHDQAVKLLKIWPQITLTAERATEPTVFEITPSARKVDRLCLTRDLS